MTQPSSGLVDDLARVSGDILILGVGGKMGPTLARLAKRATPTRRILGVARFSNSALRENLESHGIECIVCDLLDRNAIEHLPDVPNVVFMAGRKFGSSDRSDLTWATNAWMPSVVAERFRESRIVVFSTACVYPYVPVVSGGATEDIDAVPPPGEYANSCVARERIFEYFSHRHGTSGRLIRLSYSIDMRYGVLSDIAQKIVIGRPIDLTMGYVNVIWQGDANSQVLRTLAHCSTPMSPLNISGPIVSVRYLAESLASRLKRKPEFVGAEAPDAWLVNCARAESLFGPPAVPLHRMVEWTADWVSRGLESLSKETHFETRNGQY